MTRVYRTDAGGTLYREDATMERDFWSAQLDTAAERAGVNRATLVRQIARTHGTKTHLTAVMINDAVTALNAETDDDSFRAVLAKHGAPAVRADGAPSRPRTAPARTVAANDSDEAFRAALALMPAVDE